MLSLVIVFEANLAIVTSIINLKDNILVAQPVINFFLHKQSAISKIFRTYDHKVATAQYNKNLITYYSYIYVYIYTT